MDAVVVGSAAMRLRCSGAAWTLMLHFKEVDPPISLGNHAGQGITCSAFGCKCSQVGGAGGAHAKPGKAQQSWIISLSSSNSTNRTTVRCDKPNGRRGED